MAQSLEQEFPGLTWEIATLRKNGFDDADILRGIAERTQFLKQSGYSGEAVTAWLQGRPGPVTVKLNPKESPLLQQEKIKTLQEFEKSITFEGPRKATFADILSMPDGVGGLLRGIADTVTAPIKTFGSEMLGASEQFARGIQKSYAAEQGTLERHLGFAEAAMAFPRALGAPVTAFLQPMRERAVYPIAEASGIPLPEPGTVGRSALDMAVDTALGAPFLGFVPKVPSAEAAAVSKMEKATKANEAALASLKGLSLKDFQAARLRDNILSAVAPRAEGGPPTAGGGIELPPRAPTPGPPSLGPMGGPGGTAAPPKKVLVGSPDAMVTLPPRPAEVGPPGLGPLGTGAGELPLPGPKALVGSPEALTTLPPRMPDATPPGLGPLGASRAEAVLPTPKPTLMQASQTMKPVPVKQVELPKGSATVVDVDQGTVIATRLSEDVGNVAGKQSSLQDLVGAYKEATLRAQARQAGMTLTSDPSAKQPWTVVQRGGEPVKLDSLNDVAAYLKTKAQPDPTLSPVELPPTKAPSEVPAIEAALAGEPLSPAQKASIVEQRKIAVADPLATIGEVAPVKEIAGGGGRETLSWLAQMGDPVVEKPTQLRLANPLAGGLISGSPTVRSATRSLMWAEKAFSYRLSGKDGKGGYVAFMDDLKKLVPSSERAFALREGTAIPSTPAEIEWAGKAKTLMQDFARRLREQGLMKESQEISAYAPHVIDQKALWDLFKQKFSEVTKLSDLPAQLATKLTPEQFTRYKDLFARYDDVTAVPRDTLNRVKSDIFNFSDTVSTWANLPQFVKDRLPEELFVKYLLPRSGSPYVKKDFYGSVSDYIVRVEAALNFDPWLAKWKPVIESLPGQGLIFTERGVLERLADNVIFRRPTWDQRVIGSLIDRVNLMIGKEFLQLRDVDMASQLMRNTFMRGALGPDSGLTNLTQSLYTWAATGNKTIGPMFRYVVAKARGRAPELPYGVMTEFGETFGGNIHDLTPGLRQKILALDRAVTNFTLSPMALTENLNRGIAYTAGMEEAAQKGLNGSKALLVGFSRASQVVPNLELTEQMMRAIEIVQQTQVGATPATRAPLLAGRGPLGRLSTMLVGFPSHTTQFLSLGIREGFADAMLRHEPAKLIRYLATVGFIAGFPYVAYKMGADISNTFGPQSLLGLISFPIIKATMNGVAVATGHSPESREVAWNELSKTLKTMAIPQYRYGAKITDVYQNIQRGYGVDKRERFLYDTSPYMEILRLAGVNPREGYDARQVSRTLHELSFEYGRAKQAAIDGLISGDYSLAQKFMQEWQVPITSQDLRRALANRMTTPEQRALQSVPQELRPMMLEKVGR